MVARNHVTRLVNDGAGVAKAENGIDAKATAEAERKKETPANVAKAIETNTLDTFKSQPPTDAKEYQENVEKKQDTKVTAEDVKATKPTAKGK